VASGRATRSTRNAGTFASAEASVTKTASARNAGAFASAKAAVAKTASLVAPHMEEDTSAKAINSPVELVVPGKSPPVRKAKDKVIAAVATDLNATALAKDSSSKTLTTATKVAKVAVSKKVHITFSYFITIMNSYILNMNLYMLYKIWIHMFVEMYEFILFVFHVMNSYLQMNV
jgi:hypothetical protein